MIMEKPLREKRKKKRKWLGVRQQGRFRRRPAVADDLAGRGVLL
jgi:hypothetical protein